MLYALDYSYYIGGTKRPTTEGKKMKKVNVATTKNTATYYIDVFGDIFESIEEAEFCGLAGSVTRDAFYVGSKDEMKNAAWAAYHAN